MNRIKSNPAVIVSLLAGILIGIATGFAIKDILAHSGKTKLHGLEIRQGGYKFINPLLECGTPREELENDELKNIKQKVEESTKDIMRKKWADHISVYFRELNNGPWFSLGQTEEFYPASLLKVPLMIAVFKEAEVDPRFLRERVKYEGTADFNKMQGVKPSKTLKRGEYYTVEDLVSRMIVYSDNNASLLLEGIIDPDVYKKVYYDLGIMNAKAGDYRYFVSVEAYASFFRILFNASYLNKDMSEKALEYLADVEFKEGLVAGVPSNMRVAHKFGERERQRF